MAAPLTNSAISRHLIPQQHDDHGAVAFLIVVLGNLRTARRAYGDQHKCTTFTDLLVKSKSPARLALFRRP
jgi:hypothetical protein